MTTKVDHSDSEDDGEYVPPVDEGSDSDHSTDAGGEDETAHITSPKDDPESKKKERDALWSIFQASVAESSNPRNPVSVSTTRIVKVERKFLFAGKEVVEVVEVPEDSSEAKKWPLWKEAIEDPSSTSVQNSKESSSSFPTASTTGSDTKDDVALVGTRTSIVTSGTLSSSVSTSTKPGPRKPGPRKSKVTLAPLPGPAKAKKMTTLEKSAMDWKRHVQSPDESGSSVQDELEANRRTGGYLEKVDFLKRVDERKEETLESLKSNKRRRL